MTDHRYARHGGTPKPVADPTGDLRATFLARLEYDLGTDADRRDMTFHDRPAREVLPIPDGRAYRRRRPR